MLQKIDKQIEKIFNTLVPEGINVTVIRSIMYQQWEVFCTSKNEYPRKDNGQYYFFAIGYYLKNKHYIEKNLFEIAKDLHKAWKYFMDKVDMNKPRRRGDRV